MKWIRMRGFQDFFAQINLYAKGFDGVREAVGRGDETAALAQYRALLSERLPKREHLPVKDFMAVADGLLENRLSLLGTPMVELGDPINWLLTPNGDKQWQSHLAYFAYTDALLDAYFATDDSRYLQKWMGIYCDFLEHHPYGAEGLEYDVVLPIYCNEKGYKHGGEGRTPGYLGGSWIGLAASSRITLFLYALGRVVDVEEVPDLFFANVLYSLVTDHTFVVLNNARRYTPNQFLSCASSLVLLGRYCNEFKIAPAAYLVGMERLEEATELCVLPDGSDPEQSFNYNMGYPGQMRNVSEAFDGIHNPRMDALRQKTCARGDFLASLISPLNQLPAVAKSHLGKDAATALQMRIRGFESETAAEIFRAIRQGTPCRVGCAAFPYGGYYVLRSGWGREDRYLFFKASRYGMGHAHEDCNSLTLTAYGQNLLIDSANYNYADDAESARINAYFHSSFAHNTVCVGGASQTRLSTVAVNRDRVSEDWEEYEAYAAHLYGLRQKSEDSRHYFGEAVQAVEGRYHDGYDGLCATHTRRIYAAAHRFYLVVDSVTGAEEFTVNWNFAPECDLPRVENGELFTRAGEVCFSVIPLCGAERIEVACGQEDPIDGWMCLDYNKKIPCAHAQVVCKGREALTLLLPYRGEKPTVTVTDQTICVSDGEVTMTVCRRNGEDRVAVSENGQTQTLVMTDQEISYEKC